MVQHYGWALKITRQAPIGDSWRSQNQNMSDLHHDSASRGKTTESECREHTQRNPKFIDHLKERVAKVVSTSKSRPRNTRKQPTPPPLGLAQQSPRTKLTQTTNTVKAPVDEQPATVSVVQTETEGGTLNGTVSALLRDERELPTPNTSIRAVSQHLHYMLDPR